jgi:hypothetical protein
MIHSQFAITDTSGKPVATMNTSNGVGIPILAGPPYIPVLPVAIISIFYKRIHYFVMDLNIRSSDSNRKNLAIDTDNCYIIVNGAKKIPVKTHDIFMGRPGEHNYRLSLPIRFAKVHSLTITTGNPLLDQALKNITFYRRKRLTHSILGPS